MISIFILSFNNYNKMFIYLYKIITRRKISTIWQNSNQRPFTNLKKKFSLDQKTWSSLSLILCTTGDNKLVEYITKKKLLILIVKYSMIFRHVRRCERSRLLCHTTQKYRVSDAIVYASAPTGSWKWQLNVSIRSFLVNMSSYMLENI